MNSKKVKFTNARKCAFYATVKTRVEKYFTANNISVHANRAMWFKTVFFISGFMGLYFAVLFAPIPDMLRLALVALLGMFGAFVGFNVCHDAIHKSYSADQRVNSILSFVFHILGANPYVWSITHNIVHHTYTNIAGHDEDIDVARGLIRFSETEPVNRMQQYQHYYAFFLYSFSMLSWIFKKDYIKFFQRQIGQQRSKHPRIEYFNLFFFKFVHYFLFIAVPIIVLDLSWGYFLIGFLTMQFAQGIVLGLVFQLAHVVEGTAFPNPDHQGNIEEAWAAHQLQTTANFAVENRFISFFCGGLNRQIEHHIFPKICHIHYPAVGKIVKETALEFGLPYIESKTFSGAIGSHYRTLRKLGMEAYKEKHKKTPLPVIPLSSLAG